MNRKEFLEYLHQHLPSTLGKVTSQHLQRWGEFGVLRPRPEYSKDDIQTVMGLIKMEQSSQTAPSQGAAQEKPTLPSAASGTIYQVLSILWEATTEADAKEKDIVRLALLHSGLISAPGFIHINFSPFTGNTLESLLSVPEYKSRFETASASKELPIIREATQFVESKTGRGLTFLQPVLFLPGIRPTLVYSSFIFGGKGRLLGPGHYVSLPRPLYEEFLDSDMQSLDDITNFMATRFMHGGFGVPPEEDALDFIKTTQERMRGVLMKAGRGNLVAADLSPLSPFHEDDVVEANILGEMGGMDIFAPDGKPVSVGEVKMLPAYKREGHGWVPYDKNKLHIRRYYQWLDFMWAELIDAVTYGSQTPVCLRCGKLLPQKRGRRKTYCGPENPECYHARKARYVRITRSRES